MNIDLMANIINDGNTLQYDWNNHGFFSNCSCQLHCIIKYFNMFKKLPLNVDRSQQFSWFKINETDDITYDLFKNNLEDTILYEHSINYSKDYQFIEYKHLDYSNITPFIKKYFSPSEIVREIINNIEKKYNLDYDNICVLFYRSNDKVTESSLASYSEMINKAKDILKDNPDIIFLVQSDETEFIELILNTFNNAIYFKDEIKHIPKNDALVIHRTCSNIENNKYIKNFLAITIIMSKCKYLIFGSSGNCSIWISMYRGNSSNISQYLNNQWV